MDLAAHPGGDYKDFAAVAGQIVPLGRVGWIARCRIARCEIGNGRIELPGNGSGGQRRGGGHQRRGQRLGKGGQAEGGVEAHRVQLPAN